jgi:hypothetical protein
MSMSRRRADDKTLQRVAQGLPHAVRQYLASLRGLDKPYAASAVGRLPDGTVANLLATGALEDDTRDGGGFGPRLTKLGQSLIAYLASTETTTVIVPSPDALAEAYRNAVGTYADVVEPATFVLTPVAPEDGPSAIRGSERMRELRARVNQLIGDVVEKHDGLIDVKDGDDPVPAASLLIEDAEGSVRISAILASSDWTIIDESGRPLDEEPTTVPLTTSDGIDQLARRLYGVQR